MEFGFESDHTIFSDILLKYTRSIAITQVTMLCEVSEFSTEKGDHCAGSVEHFLFIFVKILV